MCSAANDPNLGNVQTNAMLIRNLSYQIKEVTDEIGKLAQGKIDARIQLLSHDLNKLEGQNLEEASKKEKLKNLKKEIKDLTKLNKSISNQLKKGIALTGLSDLDKKNISKINEYSENLLRKIEKFAENDADLKGRINRARANIKGLENVPQEVDGKITKIRDSFITRIKLMDPFQQQKLRSIADKTLVEHDGDILKRDSKVDNPTVLNDRIKNIQKNAEKECLKADGKAEKLEAKLKKQGLPVQLTRLTKEKIGFIRLSIRDFKNTWQDPATGGQFRKPTEREAEKFESDVVKVLENLDNEHEEISALYSRAKTILEKAADLDNSDNEKIDDYLQSLYVALTLSEFQKITGEVEKAFPVIAASESKK